MGARIAFEPRGYAIKTATVLLLFVLVIATDNVFLIEYRHPGKESLDTTSNPEERLAFRSATPSPEFRETRSSADEYTSLVDYSDVLIVRNNNSAVSMEIADYFKDLRNIPDINVCNITTSTAETITRDTFENEIRAPVEMHILNNGLEGIINFIVTTKGVPLRVSEVDTSDDLSYVYDRSSVDSDLALILGTYAMQIGAPGEVDNPYHNIFPYQEFTFNDYGFFLVTRLTGYNTTETKGLVDKVPGAVGKKGTFVLDVDPLRDNPSYQVANDWMRNANAALTANGFDSYLDETTTFLTDQANVSGYTSWGSNDAYYPTNSLLNPGLESDADGDGVPDNWYRVNDTGIGSCERNDTEIRSGTWSVRITRNATSQNATFIGQNYTLKPEKRYYAVGYANLSGVSADKGVYMQIIAYDSEGNIVKYYNGRARTGTTTTWVTLSQPHFEPIEGVTNISVIVSLSKSSGTVFVDDIRLYEIKPDNEWTLGALAETYVSTSARSFNYPTGYGQSLIADLIRDGVTGVKGYVYEPFLGACAHPDILFDAYTQGFFMAESYYMASAYLGWMDVVVGDPKLAVYKQSMIPDPAVFTPDITFSDDDPGEGDTVDIYVNVSNLGNYTAEGVVVHYYAGDPSGDGILLGKSILSIPAHAINQTQLSWDTAGFNGTQEIFVFVDALDDYFELDENNNIASVQITIADSFQLFLEPGWNLISLPLNQTNTSLQFVLGTILNDYDAVQWYNASDIVDSWKFAHTQKPPHLNDLEGIDHFMGLWIHITAPGGTTFYVKGSEFTASQSISLKPGWNLVGYPSSTNYNRTDGLNTLDFGTDVDAIWTYNATSNEWEDIGPTDYFELGRGYWIHAKTQAIWNVSL
ncbi:MAG: TIGR03790 family protein [Thermoplasmata archaeon]|nr:MAG: TIGR03790 family protein [Thermoplasmata archaeon]